MSIYTEGATQSKAHSTMDIKNPHPDNRYLEALVNNNSRLIREIYEKYAGSIQRLVTNNHGDPSDAQDIMQEGLMAITRQARSGKLVLTCTLGTFLYIVCSKKWLNELKKRKQSGVTFTDTERLMVGTDSMEQAMELEREEALHELLEKKLNQLSPGCQQIIRLSWSGVPLQDIAEKLGNTYDYIKKKKSECKKRLLELMREALDKEIL